MEFVDGGSLAQRLDGAPLPAREAARLVQTLASAVHAAHERGVVHRDLKPANVLLTADGTPKITDFGLAKRLDVPAGATQTGAIVGTPSYMAREQAAGRSRDIGPPADVYALGALLYELLTGRPPFRAPTAVDTLVLVQTEEPVPPSRLQPGVPRDLETVCLTCLQKERSRRYRSGETLREDLRRFLAGEPIRARPVRMWERGVKWVRRHPMPAALALVSGLAALALIGGLVGLFYGANLAATNAKLEATSGQLQEALMEVKAEKAQARRYLYVSQMTLAERAQQEGDIGRMIHLLRSVIPENPEEEDLRGFEWHHLWREYHGEQSRLRGHKGAVTAVAFSPDDRLLASGSADNTVKLWDAATGKEVRGLDGHEDRVLSVAFSPDGSRLVSASADRTVRLWDTTTGKELLCLKGHDGPVTCVAFSPDGRRIASGAEDKTVRIWNADTGELAWQFNGHSCIVTGVAFAPDAKKVASIGQELPKSQGEFVVWDASSGEVFFRKTGTGWTSVTFDPDGQHLATGNVSGAGRPGGTKPALEIWDLNTGQRLKSLSGHEGTITQVAFRPDGQQIVSSALDQTVKVWDIETRTVVVTFQEEAPALGVTFSPDGLRIASASADHTVKVWAPPGSATKTLHSERRTINNVEFNPDGRRLAGVAGSVVIWDAIRGEKLTTLNPPPEQYGRVAWSPGGESLAVGRRVWDLGIGAPVREMDRPSPREGDARIRGAGTAFSRDGKLLAAVDADDVVGIWDVTTGRCLRALTKVPRRAMCLAFGADSRWLPIGSGGEAVRSLQPVQIWDLTTGQVSITPECYAYAVFFVTFSPDGKWLAVAGGENWNNRSSPGQVQVCDATTGRQRHNLRHSASVWSAAFSPDGKRLATASGNEVKIWDMQTGQEVCSLREYARTVYGVAFSPDGRHLATAGDNAVVRIRDGTPIAETPPPEPMPALP
jgi:WD40 repeat protein